MPNSNRDLDAARGIVAAMAISLLLWSIAAGVAIAMSIVH